MADLLPPLRPIPSKERLSVLYIEYGQLDVLDGAFVVVDVTGVRTHIPMAAGLSDAGTRRGIGSAKAFGCGLLLVRRL